MICHQVASCCETKTTATYLTASQLTRDGGVGLMLGLIRKNYKKNNTSSRVRINVLCLVVQSINQKLILRGFVKFEKIQKSEKNSEVGGWVCQAPTRLLIFFGNVVFFCLFCVVFMFPIVPQFFF